MRSASERRHIKSIDRTMELLSLLRSAGEPLTLTELSEATGQAPSTVHTYLATLADHGLVCRESGDGYELGLRFVAMGEYVKHHLEVYKAGRDEITRLAQETGDSAHLIVEYDAKLLSVHEWFGENAVGVDYHEQKRERFLSHLHCTAAGKALLAHLPAEESAAIVDRHGLERMTPNTITDPDRLAEALEAIRERGYATSDEEQMQGLRAVGAPVRDSDGYPVGAISVAAPAKRLRGDEWEAELPERVMRTANVIEVNYRAEAPE